MRVEKVGRKWIIEGKGKGWIFGRTFPMKWKAQIALEVFKEGGKVSDYWKASREYAAKHPKTPPWRAIEKVTKALEEIKRLYPTCEEIEEYGKGVGYGVVTITEHKRYFSPHLHNTWEVKKEGRVHIDIGSGGYHLMLDKHWAENFIKFIKNKRKKV